MKFFNSLFLLVLLIAAPFTQQQTPQQFYKQLLEVEECKLFNFYF